MRAKESRGKEKTSKAKEREDFYAVDEAPDRDHSFYSDTLGFLAVLSPGGQEAEA